MIIVNETLKIDFPSWNDALQMFSYRRMFFFSILNSKNWWQFPLTGLFLRTLEHIQLTVYATLSHEGLLYAGGSNKAIVYYDFAVSVFAFPLLIFGKEAN